MQEIMILFISEVNGSEIDGGAMDQTQASIYRTSNELSWFKVNFYYAMNCDFFEMEPHQHREFEIMYVANGRCKIFSWDNDELREDWNIKEGEYVFIDCFTKHQLEVVKGNNCRILNLEISLLPRWNELCLQQFTEQSKSLQFFLNMPVPIFKGKDASGNLHRIITELHKQLQSDMDDSENHVIKNLILAQFIIEIARQRTKKYHMNSGSKYIRKANAYLSTNFDHDIKIKEIAEEVGISVAYLQRLYKEQTGKTLVDKLNELRIEKAKTLLEASSLPITDIAISVGFNNRQHFTYTFDSVMGCSPTIYRKNKGNYRIWAR